ncbi:MAG: hypothetical protein AAGA99_00530 [Actinomycetota bacterium]
MTFTEKDIQIIVQSSGKDAAAIAAGMVTPETTEAEALRIYASLHVGIHQHIVSMIQEEQAQLNVEQTFQGAVSSGPVQAYTPPQPTQAPAPAPVQAPVAAPQASPAPQAPPAPAGATGDSKKNEAWRQLIHEFIQTGRTELFYDNRADKKNPNGPDFKRKSDDEALWLYGKYPAPAWVLGYFENGEVPW